MTRSASDRPITLRLQLPRNTLKIVGLAFVAGLLCFSLVWMKSRKTDFYTAEPAPTNQPGNSTTSPLPQPLPAASSGELPDARPAPTDEPPAQLADGSDTPPAAPAAPAAPAQPTPAPAPTTPQTETTAAPALTNERPQPIPGQSPAPRYPRIAMQRGEGGTVVVRFDVDATGIPSQVSVYQRSGIRALDRAALKAARKWRFQPARRDGQPIAASIDIPFNFKPGDP